MQVLKKLCKEEREASKPCDVVTGVVKKADPLKITVSQKMILDEDFLIKTEYFDSLELSKGDKVVMIKQQGGQAFLLLDRVVT